MADKTVTTFEKVGTSQASARNASAEPSRNTKPVAKRNTAGGPVPAQQASRKGIQERLGAKYAPQATLYAANAASAGETHRKVVLVPSAVGNRDFWGARQAAGN